MLKNLLREPLLHFLLIGVVLFLVYYLQNDDAAGADSNQIVITEAHVDRLISMWEKQRQRLPTRDELNGLIEGQVREEVLYREALNLGLDRNDAGVRRRLARKMEFLFADISDQVEPTESQLEDYLAANKEKFEVPGRIDFFQVYFNTDKHGEQAGEDAGMLLARLAQDSSNLDLGAAGDRFMFGYEHEQLSVAEVGSMFGMDFSERLFRLPVGSWQGPVPSSYGLHLVYIRHKSPTTLPGLDAVRDKVRSEWLSVQRREMDEIFYQRLREQYEVVVEPRGKAEQ